MIGARIRYRTKHIGDFQSLCELAIYPNKIKVDLVFIINNEFVSYA